MTNLAAQRRSTKIAMSPTERDAYLSEQRVCRVATVGADGQAHVVPLWFAWDGEYVWLTSLTRSQRYVDLLRDNRISIVVDDGEGYHELRGVQLTGRAEPIGESPVPAGEDHAPEVARAAAMFGDKYFSGANYANDGWHAWLRVTPTKIVSWDFTKNSALRPQ